MFTMLEIKIGVCLHQLITLIHLKITTINPSLVVKNTPASEGDVRDASSISGSRRSPGEGNDTHSSIFVWRAS